MHLFIAFIVYFGDHLSKKKTMLVVNLVKSDRWKFSENKTLHTAFTGLPVFLTEAKMNFFDTTENLHRSKLANRILFHSVL